jgi:hypothetical protein
MDNQRWMPSARSGCTARAFESDTHRSAVWDPFEPERLITRLSGRLTVWGPEYRDDLEYLRVWMRRLATKLGDDDPGPRAIRDYMRLGYALNVTDPSPHTIGASELMCTPSIYGVPAMTTLQSSQVWD